jgi:hypothetical protein
MMHIPTDYPEEEDYLLVDDFDGGEKAQPDEGLLNTVVQQYEEFMGTVKKGLSKKLEETQRQIEL